MSYATGTVAGERNVGGLVGRNIRSGSSTGTVTASYWATTTSGRTTSAGGQGRTTAQLQAPMDYTGIYAQWNVDLNDDSTNDDPWDFGMDDEYPVLAVNVDGDGDTTWEEFGYQLRDGITLTATIRPDRGGVELDRSADRPLGPRARRDLHHNPR